MNEAVFVYMLQSGKLWQISAMGDVNRNGEWPECNTLSVERYDSQLSQPQVQQRGP